MKTTPILGIVYPEAHDHTRLWDHFEDLAESIETAVAPPLFGAWTAFVPTWRNAGGVGLDIASGTLEGRYKLLGKTVFGSIRWVRAADSNVGTAYYTWDLPVGLPPINRDNVHGIGHVRQAGTGTDSTVMVRSLPNLDAVIATYADTRVALSNSNRFPWAANDVAAFDFRYEVA